MSLTVIVPFYNEEKHLKKSVERLIQASVATEIIIVDDRSTDKSYNIAKELTKKNKNIRLIQNLGLKGKGGAINFVKAEVKTKFIAIHDADLEYFPSDLKKMLTEIEKHPSAMIIGSRFKENLQRKNKYFRTILGNKIVSKFFSLMHGDNISDVATCYKMFSNEFFQEIQLQESGFAIEVEFISKFVNKKGKIIEVPIKYEGRSYEEGKKIKFLDGIKYIICIIKYKK